MASSDTQATKRERQKQRRDAKLAQQRRQAARARRNRLIALAAVAVVALAAVGVLVQRRVAEQRGRAETIAAAEARQAELGCTPVSEQQDLGGGQHLQDPAQIAAAPPDVLYPDRPASSGPHLGSVALTGVYDQQIDERLLVHNLEHGYVNVFYDAEADPAQVDALRTFAQAQIDGERPKIVVSPYGEPLQGDANFAYTAWGWRQLCGTYDDAVLSSFLEQHYNGEQAPERYLTPHVTAGSGVLDPNAVEGPLLFPPLAGAQQPEGEATEQPSGSSEIPSAQG